MFIAFLNPLERVIKRYNSSHDMGRKLVANGVLMHTVAVLRMENMKAIK